MPDKAPANATVEDTDVESNDNGAEDNKVVLKTSGDVKKLLEKVRAEEKSKLYPQIEHYKKIAETSAQQIEVLTNELKKVQTDTEKTKNEKKSESEDIKKQLEDLKQQLLLADKRQNALAEEAQRQIAAQKLEAYKARAIANAGGEIIPEMIEGDSETEIDAAIIQSKARFKEIKDQVQKALKAQRAAAPLPGPSGTPPNAAPQDRPDANELTAQMIGDMDPKKWAEDRLAIRKAVDSQMKRFFQGQ